MSRSHSPDHAPLASLYASHHSWLHGWLRRHLHNAAEAADLAQDTFVRLMSVPPQTVAAVREPKSYLATVAKRLMLDHLRRQSLEQAYVQALEQLPEAHAPSAEQQVAVLQLLKTVDAMLQQLPAKVRAVFILSQVDGLPYAEIARELDISLRSVKRYMAQAMAECILLDV